MILLILSFWLKNQFLDTSSRPICDPKYQFIPHTFHPQFLAEVDKIRWDRIISAPYPEITLDMRCLTCPTVIDSEMVKIANKMKLVGKLLRKRKWILRLHEMLWITLSLNSHSERPNAGHGDDDGNACEEANTQRHPERNLVATKEEGSGGCCLGLCSVKVKTHLTS